MPDKKIHVCAKEDEKEGVDAFMKVRYLTDSDIPGAAGIEAVCFSEPWSEKALSDTLHSAYGVLLCTDPDGDGTEKELLSGYAGMYVMGDDADVTNVAVLPEYRRRGIGRALVEALCAEARARGARLLHLEVRASNSPALALYEASGFVRDGVRRNFYRKPAEDAVLMTKTL